MGVSIIIGGQFGSEGKGKVSHWFANKIQASSVIRVGGINSGHTVIDAKGRVHIFRVLPTVAIDNRARCILPAGSYFDVELLFREISDSGIDPKKVIIDPSAMIITNEQIIAEQQGNLKATIGSTNSGTGATVSSRINRKSNVVFAKDVPSLAEFIEDTVEYIRKELDFGKEVIIEGTQEFGLSNLHTPYFPFATSRDTTAAGFLSEAGLSPFDVTNIIMVLRTFPIRVAGNSGPLPKEISWDEVTKISGASERIEEYTSVTRNPRRVAMFDSEIVKKAIRVNNPNLIVLNHMDYIGQDRHHFLQTIENSIGQKVNFVGINAKDIFDVKEM